ncbi:MAG: hypothetical protein JO345_02045 [Streptosporangiaceae bacterium]|nr:hypothetical protein [Streptosporangiaceae bacterium]
MTRSRTIAMALAALAILTGIVIAVIPNGSSQTRGHSNRPSSAPPSAALPSSPVTPVVDVSGLHWTDFHGYRLPVSAQAGPRITASDLASGFADTPLGALVAMINIGARTAWQFGPGVFQPTIQSQVTGPYASQMLSADLDAYGSGAAEIPDIGAYASFVAYQWAGYTPSDATADLVVEGPGADGTTIFAATQIQAQWIDSDWRVVAPPGGDWANSATQIPSLNGYLTFPGQEG